MLKRKQIQLTERQAAAVHREAARRRLSDAAFIRELVDRWMRAPERDDLDARYARAARWFGKFRSGLPDLSEEHDKYLDEAYGDH